MDLFGNPDEMQDKQKVRPLKRKTGELTRLQHEFLDKAVALYGETALERGQLGYIHTLHANCYLPRGKIDARQYVHKNGAYSVLLQAGALPDPQTGEWVDQPLPYGGKPRALLAYINSYAVRHKTSTVPLGHSLTDFVRRMSGEASGGQKGALNLWKKQMMALAASSMRISGCYGSHAKARKVDIITEIDLWLSPEPNQYSLFPTEIVLSADYLDTLHEHAMPVDLAALRLLQGDPLAFDVFVWLAYRLPRVRQPNGVKLSWKLLYEQFGGQYALERQFKARFTLALRKVQALYQDAKLDSCDKSGLVLYTSPSMVKHRTSVRTLGRLKAPTK